MAQFPALPLWTDSYIADCSHLTFAEHGAYLSILLLMWRSPDCRIPNDDDWIMRKLRCDADAMRTHVRSVMREFCEIDEWVTQKRLRKEWLWCQNKRKKNTDSANSRWGKDNRSCEGNANGYANAMPPYPSLPTPLKEVTTTTTALAVAVVGFDEFFKAMPRRWDRKAALPAYEAALTKTTAEILLAAAQRYAVTARDYETQYILPPAKWLDAERWHDGMNGAVRETAFNTGEEAENQRKLREKYYGQA